mgnify:CR=1 FL=1
MGFQKSLFVSNILSLVVSEKDKINLPYDPANLLIYLHKGNENICSHNDFYVNIHSSFIA